MSTDQITTAASHPFSSCLAHVVVCMHYLAGLLQWQQSHAVSDLFIRNNKTPAKAAHCGVADSSECSTGPAINQAADPVMIKVSVERGCRAGSIGTAKFTCNYIQITRKEKKQHVTYSSLRWCCTVIMKYNAHRQQHFFL